ncbi:uncharacterized protein LOC125043375 [Penaeus chinensis]|uniref:uncharacterized protein LOC125043375 n=1 Tax=Penaeus chinensis TaxID=139456 RepID=UPI001FB6D6EF|nr:uncharacterized protein LOC125043375 [Penaeus chinensis]
MSVFHGHYSHGSSMEESYGTYGDQQFITVAYFPENGIPSEHYGTGATFVSPQDSRQASGTTSVPQAKCFQPFYSSQEAEFFQARDFFQATDSFQVHGFSQSTDLSQVSNSSQTADQDPWCRQRSSTSRKGKITKWHELPPQASTEAEEKRLRAVKGKQYREKCKARELRVKQDLDHVTEEIAQLRSEMDRKSAACVEMERRLDEAIQRHDERDYSYLLDDYIQ